MEKANIHLSTYGGCVVFGGEYHEQPALFRRMMMRVLPHDVHAQFVNTHLRLAMAGAEIPMLQEGWDPDRMLWTARGIYTQMDRQITFETRYEVTDREAAGSLTVHYRPNIRIRNAYGYARDHFTVALQQIKGVWRTSIHAIVWIDAAPDLKVIADLIPAEALNTFGSAYLEPKQRFALLDAIGQHASGLSPERRYAPGVYRAFGE